eukprot:CAMPEP_0170515766 /NCGR_PEP_ID=MMETSP0209-20121228/2155_1 /TAXON_ID=665100 ORGANISM="Litonotus pictus, Strain P1" /NCGR_SAMPLE_ID=MMETSP0209 /ASSEMBLY_ACC=CAM_ASM_000301 /LENGTH=395 /DNA_ID=CAMNT_0010800401 /DNA_START=119 /DNA_END=1306 /DNA_ORIENTATION=-
MAISLEAFDREERQAHVLGGLHDYISTLSEDDIVLIISDYVKVYEQFRNLSELEELASILKNEEPSEKLVDQLLNYPKQNLIEMALAAETYIKRKEGHLSFRGGLHDYIWRLNSDDIARILVQFNADHPEITLEAYHKISTKKQFTETEMRDRLEGLDQTRLAHYAIALDEYDRNHSGIHRKGGLHDYAFTLQKPILIEIIIDFANKWPEMFIEGRLENILKGELNLFNSILGGFEDYSFKMHISDLKACALTAEDYDRKQRKVTLYGGLHDYIDSLNKNQVLKILSQYIRKYPALREAGYLEGLAGIHRAGLEGFLETRSLENLRQYCLNLENYDRKIRAVDLDGGLHDYVNTLTKKELIDYVVNKSEYYPQLRQTEHFNNINTKYSVRVEREE